MDLRGQRFTVDFSDDDEDETGSASRLSSNAPPSVASAFIGDIQERSVGAPSAPRLKPTPNGFPEHKKRTRMSAFKQQRAAAAARPPPAQSSADASRPLQHGDGLGGSERQQIDEENKQRLAAMSQEEIDEERNELLSSLDPSLIQRLLRRANLDQGRGDTGIEPPPASRREEKEHKESPSLQEGVRAVTPSEGEGVAAPTPAARRIIASHTVTFEEDNEPTNPIHLQPASNPPSKDAPELSQPSVHFPNAPSAPELDPNDPSFLENLHSKYFPSLPADPSKLAWMAPLPSSGSIADQDSPYYPANGSLPASALRFDFRGGILPPRISRAMPATKGLHHHGEAPEAAGYTVPELARLARSAFPAQRCIAFQTLGRLLYRLGRGEWGAEDSEITKGLWRCVEEGKVIETLEEAAGAEGGHQGSKVYAVEAVWLWQKGGGKVWKAS